MLKQVIYSFLWPEIKLGKEIKGGWFLEGVYPKIPHRIDLVLQNKSKEKLTLFLVKNTDQKSPGNISRNFSLFIDPSIKNNSVIKYIVDVIKKKDKGDFLFLEKPVYYKKHPIGIVFTITHKCVLKCKFCFNSYDYELKKRNQLRDLSTSKIKEAIDKFYNDGIRIIILSGGEPLIRDDFFEILDYLYQKNIYTIINTNGTLIDKKIVQKLTQYPIHLMLSLHEFNDKDSLQITGQPNIFSRRKRSINLLKKNKVFFLEYVTILTKKNINQLEKIYSLLNSDLKPNNWQFFRLFNANDEKGSRAKEMQLAIDKLIKLNKEYKVNFHIVDSVPFCVHKNPAKASKVVSGELHDEHMIKLVTDPRGNIKMMCSFQRDLGNIFSSSISECWQSDFAQKMVNLEFTPKECSGCSFVKDCGGGSRFLAYTHYGSYSAPDPLANFKNIKP